MVRVKHGVAVLQDATGLQRLRHGAVRSVSGNPFLSNKSRLKSFRASSKTGLKPPVLASRSIVSDCDYYLLANNVLWHGSDCVISRLQGKYIASVLH
ncbi:MAG: hypothetical protein FWC70_04845 [Defluviitaleaceae bacterium]|nr:hypothetical protein [Defluviitaleaceae bacterium]